MGTSTKKTYNRAPNLLQKNINNGNINSNGSGISSIIPELIFPKNGQSKVLKSINKTFSSPIFYQSIKKIFNISKKVSTGGISSIGIQNFENKKLSEQIELLADELGISNEPYLKQAFSETIQDKSLEELFKNPISIIVDEIKNLLKFHCGSFSIEDCSSILQNFNIHEVEKDLDDYFKDIVTKSLDDNLMTELSLNINNDKRFVDLLNFGKIKILKQVKAA